MVIAIATSGVLMMPFRKRWLAKINIAFTNRIASLFAGWLPGFGILNARGSEVWEGLPYSAGRISNVQRLPSCAYVQQPIRMGRERARVTPLRTEESRQDPSAFLSEGRARHYEAALSDSCETRAERRGCG